MRTEIYQWMKNLAFFHVLTTAVLHILPDKRYEQYVRLFMGLLLVLLICTPVFGVIGKSGEFMAEAGENYRKEEQKRMETETAGFQELFLRDAYKEELKKQIRNILEEQGIFSAETEIRMERDLQIVIKVSGKLSRQQEEAVKNGLEGICGLRSGQYQILDPEDGVEGVGSDSASGTSSSDSRASGIAEAK